MKVEKKGCLAPDCHTTGQQTVSGHKEHNLMSLTNAIQKKPWQLPERHPLHFKLY